MIDRSQVDEFGGTFAYYDSGKAARELGFIARPIGEVARRTVAWLLDRGFVPEARRSALTPHPSLRGLY